MLTTVEQILAWFDDFGGKTNPYWVLYASSDKPDSTKRRGMNWETGEYEKARALLKATLERFSPMGGAYYLTVSDKAKDNAPSAGINIIWASGTNSQTFSGGGYSMVNGVPVPFTNISNTVTQDSINLHISNTELRMRLEMEQRERERDKREAAQIGGGLVGWLNGLTQHPQFDPNTPFNMIAGLLGTIMGVPTFTANPQGLPAPQVQVGFSTDNQQQPQAAAAQTPPSVQEPVQEPVQEGEAEKDVKFTYDVQEIAMNYHKFCENMGIPLEQRNGFLGAMNGNIEKMPIATRQMFVAQFAQKPVKTTESNV